MSTHDTRQLTGPTEVTAALDGGEPLGLVLVGRDALDRDPEIAALVARAQAAGVPVRIAAARELERMSRTLPVSPILALRGPRPSLTLDELMRAPGAVWLLSRIAYGTNAGFAIRTVEVAGAAGVVIDSTLATAQLRRSALRASIRADRYLPVLWLPAEDAITAAAAVGRRIIGIEDVGEHAPWESDLTGDALFVVGGEQEGIPPALLARCDDVVCLPMFGFIPSYNLQAAVAAVAAERLRQCAIRAHTPEETR